MNFYRGTTNVGAFGTKASLIGGTSNDMMLYSASNDWIFYSTGERMRVQADGKVGIGTNAPAATLDVRSSDSVVAYIIRPSASPTVHIGSATSAGAQLGYVHASDYAFFGHDAVYNAIVVNSSGSVGIGTVAPPYPLSIKKGSSAIAFSEYSNGAVIWLDGANGDFAGGDYFQILADDAALRFGYAGVTKVSMLLNGRFGVGTATPEDTLDVNGNAIVRGNLYFDGVSSSYIDNSSHEIQIRGANGVSLWSYYGAGWTERLTVADDGNVGIGTGTPIKKLDVRASESWDGIHIGSTAGSATAIDFARSTTHANPTARIGVAEPDATHTSDMRFYTSDATGSVPNLVEKMRIDPLGRVLIGVNGAMPLRWWNGTTYGAKLFVENNGSTAAADYVTAGVVRNTNDGEAPQLGFAKSRGTTTGAVTVVQSGDAIGTLTFQGADGTNYVEAARINAIVDGTPGADDMPGRLQFSTTADGTASPTVRMVIMSDGNVGIGTVSPAAHLHVSKGVGATTVLTQVAANSTVGYEIKKTGSTTQHWKIVDGQTANGYLEIYDATDSATRMAFNTDGNVGIGTVNAPHLLTLKGDGKYFAAYASDGSMAVQLGSDSSGDGNFILYDHSGGTKVKLYAESGGANYINNGGSVGIGTATPAAKLHTHTSGHNSLYVTTAGTSSSNAALWFSHNYPTAGDWAGIIWGTDNILRINNSGSSSDEHIAINEDGNVGIGTDNPGYPLQVYYAGGATIGMQVKGTANRAKLVVTDNDTSAYVIAEDSYASFGRQDALSASNLNINSSGSVGIGTNAASTFVKLNVQGATRLGRGSNDLGSYDGDDFDLFVGNGPNGSKIMLYDDESAYHSALIQYGNSLFRIGLNNSNSAPTIRDDSTINIIPAGVGIGVAVFTARLAVKSAGSTTDQIVVVHSGNSVEIAQLGQSANGSSAGTLLLKNNSGTDKIYLDAAGSSYFRGGSITVGVDDTGHDVRLYGATTSRYWEWDESDDLVRQRDGVKTTFGNGTDLMIWHDGSNSYVQQGSNGGNLNFTNSGGSKFSAVMKHADAVELYFNGTKKLETTSAGITVSGDAIIGSAATKLKTYSDSTYSGIYNGSSLASDESIYFGAGTTYFINDGSSSLVIDSNQRVQLKGTDYQLQYVSGSHIWYTRLQSNGTFAIHKNGVGDHLSIDSSGNVLLQKSTGSYLQFKDSTQVRAALNVNDGADGLVFSTGSGFTERMRITNTGLVGIGTNAALASSGEVLAVYSASTGHSCFKNSSDSTGTVYIRNASTTANTWQPYLICADTGGNRAGLAVKYSTAGLKVHGQGGIEFWTGSSFGGGSKKFEIDGNGAAIFSQSPTYKVKLTYSNGNTSAIIDTVGGNLELRVQDTEVVRCSTGTWDFKKEARFPNNTGLYWLHADGSATAGIKLDTSDHLDFRTGGANSRMTLDDNGNLGIGTSAPARSLDVDGRVLADTYGFRTDTTLRWYYFDNYSGSNFMGRGGNAYTALYDGGVQSMVWKAGSVGIGVAAPTSLLHVTGDLGNSAFLAYFYNSGTQSEDNGLNVQIASSGSSAQAFKVNTGGDSNSFIVAGDGDVGVGFTPSSFAQKFNVNGNTYLSGSVGIGDSTPSYKLDVSGTGRFTNDVTIAGNVGINGTTPSSSYGLQVGGNALVSGSFSASSKSFLINHPTKENKKLEYGCLEGPEFGVYHRGRAQSTTISLPDYWTGLVREETITVQLTPKGSFQHLYVVSQSLTEIVIGAADGETIDCFYTIYGERADIDRLEVEKEV